jgi:ubiquinol-cytochrome c reductase cytochrome c subunit
LLAIAAVLMVSAALTPVVLARRGDVFGNAAAAAPGQSQDGETQQGDAELLERGEELYTRGCSSCHGPMGGGVINPDGTRRGPSLREAGEAGAFYFLSTGRMPMSSSEEQPRRKPPAYPPDDIDALVAYVASLGDGPALPDVDLDAASEASELADGGELFRDNCQACHSASGAGGALSYGRAAPPLGPATPEELGAAVRFGPGQMPVFGTDVVTDQELNELARYVTYLDDPDDPGGLPIGRVGPIPEGFVAWLVGMVALLGFTAWIGTRRPIRRPRHGASVTDGAAPTSVDTSPQTTQPGDSES